MQSENESFRSSSGPRHRVTSPLRLLHLSASPQPPALALSAPAPVVSSACLPAQAPLTSHRILARKEGGFIFSFSPLLDLFYILVFTALRFFAHCFRHRLQPLRIGSQNPERPRVSKTQRRYLYWLLNLLGHRHGLACSPHIHKLFSFIMAVNCLLLRSRYGGQSTLQ